MARAAGTDPVPVKAGMFAADDEVGHDLASVDWAATPLGPPGSWPQSLQTAVDIVLSSRFSMWMAWGPRLTFFCNAAYRRDTLGRKYPWALGRPASEVWAEIWDDIGPRIGTVLTTGKATWDEALLLFLERSGYPEETYHTFSYSPLRDDAGADDPVFASRKGGGRLTERGIHAMVKRAAKVTVRAQDRTGKPFEIAAEGLLAKALQHEIDHLNGLLFGYSECGG